MKRSLKLLHVLGPLQNWIVNCWKREQLKIEKRCTKLYIIMYTIRVWFMSWKVPSGGPHIFRTLKIQTNSEKPKGVQDLKYTAEFLKNIYKIKAWILKKTRGRMNVLMSSLQKIWIRSSWKRGGGVKRLYKFVQSIACEPFSNIFWTTSHHHQLEGRLFSIFIQFAIV